MDFDDHEGGGGEEEEEEQEQEEEPEEEEEEEEEEIMVGLPVGPGYDAALVRGGGGRGGGSSKMGGRGEPAVAVGSSTGYGRKAHGGGGKYRECLKNHAVGIGGHAVDGCGEFMAAGEDGSLDALRCAACGCHRNFHRKDAVAADEAASAAAAAAAVAAGYHPHFTPYYQMPYLPHHYPAAALVPPVPPPHQYQQQRLALPSTSDGGGHFREEMEEDVWNSTMAGGGGGGRGVMASASGVRKRFRTKFTAEQKEKMLAFAEWVGWRIPKHEEAAVQKFCEETSIKRHVLKVWMHNNKHTLAKKP